MTMILYGLPVSTYSAKTRIVLRAKNVLFEEREPPEGYRSAAYRAINPMGTIPALINDGRLISESEAINEYLEERFPTPRMLPETVLDRAHARFLGRVHDLHLEPVVRSLFPHVNASRRDAAFVATRAADFRAQLARLAQLAQPTPFLAAPFLSLADCGFAVSIPLGAQLFAAMGHAIELPSELERWQEAVTGHPAVSAVLEPWREATTRWLRSQNS